jgi:hypothetical protein
LVSRHISEFVGEDTPQPVSTLPDSLKKRKRVTEASHAQPRKKSRSAVVIPPASYQFTKEYPTIVSDNLRYHPIISADVLKAAGIFVLCSNLIT